MEQKITTPGITERRFEALMENNGEIFALVNEKLDFIFRSSSAARITGWSDAEFEKISAECIHPNDIARIKTVCAEALKNTAKTIPVAARLKHRDGKYIWLQGTVTNMINDQDVRAIVINLQDITKQKEADGKIAKANRLYFFISQVNQMIVKATGENTLFKEACRIAVDIGGFRMAWIGVIAEETKDLLPVALAGEEKERLRQISIISAADGPGVNETGRALRDGRYIFCNNMEKAPEMAPWAGAAASNGYCSCISLPIKKSGKVTGAFTLYAAATDFFNNEEIELLREATGDISFAMEVFEKEGLRKKAEEELFNSKQRYQTLAEISPVGIFHTDATGYTTYVNPRWCQISGMSREEALGNGWLNAVHEKDREALGRGWQEATKNEDLSFSEYRFIRPDGTVVWVLGQAVPERNAANEIVGYVGTITDMTERKKAQEEIEKIYKDKETVLNSISDGMVSVDSEWRYTFLNDAAITTHPAGREQTIGKVIWDVHPEMKNTFFWDRYHEAMTTRQVIEVEDFYPILNTWFSVKVYPSYDGLTIFYRDITERKKAEEKIIKNEIILRKAQEIGKLGYWQLDLKSDLVWASKEAKVIFGFPPVEGELERQKIIDCIVDKEITRDAIDNLVKYNKEYNYNIEYRINPVDGSAMKYIAALAELEVNENGEPVRILGTLQDITERIKTRDEIMKEKNISDSIINSLPGIFYLYTREGKFLRWNKNFEKITGYDAAEIRQMHPLDFFDTSAKERISKKISNVFNFGEDNVQADLLLKTKEKIPYYFTGTAIEYEGSICLAGVGIDFSERTRAQQKIRDTTEQLRKLTAHLQSIREEERKRIGREIHDDLGQQLTAIKMDIAWIDKKIAPEETMLKDKLRNVIGLLDGSNLSIRRILSELRPVILDNRGLLEAIDWQGRQIMSHTGIVVQFTSNETELKLPEPVATCIFRVYQEALTNIVRYAGDCKVLTSLNIGDDIVEVCIQDDGRGFDPDAVQSNTSFGILGMQERVLSLSGEFELIAEPGKGTKISMRLPVTTTEMP